MDRGRRLMTTNRRFEIIARYGAKTPGGRIRFCTSQQGKVVFDHVRDALDAGRELLAAGSDRMKPYECPDGGHFHLRTVRLAGDDVPAS